MTTIGAERQGPGGWRPARWVVPFFALAAVLLLPWIVVLAALLPSEHAAPHWDITWVGFDAVLSLLLISVAYAAWRRSPWLEGAATAAAALLLVDAWFDVTTSATRVELVTALALAVLVELPLAVLCFLLARDTERVLALRWNRHPRNSEGPRRVGPSEIPRPRSYGIRKSAPGPAESPGSSEPATAPSRTYD